MCKKQSKQNQLVITVIEASLIQVFLALLVVYFGDQAATIRLKASSVVTQVTQDWNSVPWTAIRVGSEKCDYDLDKTMPFFYKEWLGTVRGCKIPDEAGDYKITTVEQARKEGKPCIEVAGQPAQSQTEFFEMYICGVKNGPKVKDLVRPDANGNCPQGMAPCDEHASIDNQVCHLDDADTLRSLCPITDIKVVTLDEEKYFSSEIYSKQWLVRDQLVFMYSKKSGGRPLIQTKVEHKPCLIPDETSYTRDQAWYPLEVRPSGCSEGDSLGSHDLRYETIGMPSISQLDIQSSSGVTLKLRSLPLYQDKYFPAYSHMEIKKKTFYDFWVRPTIEWQHSCEHGDSPVTRSDIVESLNLGERKIPLFLETSLFLTIFIFFVLACNFFMIVTKRFEDCAVRPYWIGPLLFSLAVQILASIFVIALTHENSVEFSKREEAFSKLEALNRCSDNYTQIDYGVLDMQLGESRNMIKFAYFCAAVFTVITVGCQIFVIWGLTLSQSEIRHAMIERQMVYKSQKLENQVIAREGNYRSDANTNLQVEDLDRD